MGVVRTLSTYANAITVLEGAAANARISPAWLQARTSLTKRQVLDALKLARERGVLTWVSRGVWSRTEHAGAA